MDGQEIADRLYGRPARPRADEQEPLFPRYAAQYDGWSEVARSLPRDVDVDAMADAARDEARRRRATRPERPAEGRRAGR